MLGTGNNRGSKVEALVAKLAKLVQSRFSCELRYVALGTSEADLILRENLLKTVPYDHEGAWLFPVYKCFQVVGYAEVTGYAGTSEEQKRRLANFIELFLEPAIEMSDQLDTLKQVEEHISRADEDYGRTNNVIPLRRPTVEGTGIKTKPRARLGFALPCLVEGPTAEDLKAMAMELHELSGRYAFVYCQDVKWKFAEDLKDLGSVTLFIPDITALTFDDQLKLLKYLSSSPSVDEPQVITGTLKTYSELRSEELMIPELLHRLSVCFLRMDRPFAEYRREGIVEFFFGSLVRDDLQGRLI